MSLRLNQLLALIVAGLMAATNASAQVRGSVRVSARVLPSPLLVSRNLPPSEATGHSVTATAQLSHATVTPTTTERPRITTVGRPRAVGRSGQDVEFSVTIVIHSNVSCRVLVEADAMGTSRTAGLQVQDASGQFRSLIDNGPVVAVEAAAAGSNRPVEIRYRVHSAAAAGHDVLPMRLTLQTSAML